MKAIVKKVEKKFWIAQAIAALMGLSAITGCAGSGF